MATETPKNILKIIKEHTSLEVIKDGQKVKCSLSGHEMPCKLEAINSYLQGKKYTKLKAQHDFAYGRYKQHLVPSTTRGREHQLFCLLTLRHCNTAPHHIQNHLNGKRFKKAFQRWEECQSLGEVFHPRPGKKKAWVDEEEEVEKAIGNKGNKKKSSGKVKEESESEEESGEEDEEEDDMTDLYPVEDFESEEEEEMVEGEADEESEASDFEVESMEVEEKPEMPASNGESTSKFEKKRKSQVQSDVAPKKFKNEKKSQKMKKNKKGEKKPC